jgi:hypothetical protein
VGPSRFGRFGEQMFLNTAGKCNKIPRVSSPLPRHRNRLSIPALFVAAF